MLKQKIFVLCIFLLSTINSQTIEIEKANVNIQRNEIVFKVKGLVCSFCAQGLQKSLSKLKFIDKKKYQKGVYVDIENQYTLVAVKDGSKIKIDDAVSAIVDAGYEVDNIYHNPYGDKIETSFSANQDTNSCQKTNKCCLFTGKINDLLCSLTVQHCQRINTAKAHHIAG